MIIRKAIDGDEEGIIALLAQVLAVHNKIRPDLFLPEGGKYNGEMLRELFRDESRPIFVAVAEDGSILGHCFCILEDHFGVNETAHRTVYIDDLCVDENHRKEHVGKALYDFVVDYAKKEGFYNITLHLWEGNDPAKAFYENVGFKPYMMGMEVIL